MPRAYTTRARSAKRHCPTFPRRRESRVADRPHGGLGHSPVDNAQISAHNGPMRRKAGTLIPIEQSILAAAMQLRSQGTNQFHGFQIAKEIQDRERARLLTSHGTLYRALARLKEEGFLESRWENPEVAVQENRPRRKYYRITAVGETAVLSQLPEPSDLRRRSFRIAGATSC